MLFDGIQAKKIAMFDFTKNHTFVDVADMTSQYVDTNIIDHFELLHDHFSDYFT